MRTNFPYVGSSYLFLIQDKKILLQRRCNTGFEDGNYGVPAGHLDGGESAAAGCAREIHEEIGIIINPADLQVAHVMHRKAAEDERIDFFFTTKKYSGEITNMEPGKCDDVSWFPLNELSSNIVPYVAQAIEGHTTAQFYSEYGW